MRRIMSALPFEARSNTLSKMKDFLELFQTDNPVFTGGIGLGLLAVGAKGLSSGYSTALLLLKRHFLVTLEITSKDRAYPWVLQWLTSHSKKNQHLSVETTFKPINSIVDVSSMTSKEFPMQSIFDFVPCPGQHFIWYNGMFINVERFREQQMTELMSGKPWEKIQFTALGRDTKPFESILQEAFLLACFKEEGKTTIYTNWGSEWRPFGNPRKHRPLSSVILDEGISDKILNDVIEWKNSINWYLDRGIPYRRGYLLHGPPGSGKSSFIMALAGHLNYNICILNLAESGLSDDRLALALSSVPPQSIVLLEDIDAAFPSRINSTNSGIDSGNKIPNTLGRTMQNHSSSNVTFSGLLNVLDGVASSEERLLFMTTNHVDRLDSALIRPGRVDVMQLIDDATQYQIKAMFTKFYMQKYNKNIISKSLNNNDYDPINTVNESHSSTAVESPLLMSLQEEFLNKLKASGKTISMAKLQGHFMRHKLSPADAVSSLDELLLHSVESVDTNQQQQQLTKRGYTSYQSQSQAQQSSNNTTTTTNIPPLSRNIEVEEEVEDYSTRQVKSVGRRVLAVHDIDKMVFNPQPGWDDKIKSI